MRAASANERAAEEAERLWGQIGEAGQPLLVAAGHRSWRPSRRRVLQFGLASAAAAAGLALMPRYPFATVATATGERARSWNSPTASRRNSTRARA